MRTSGPSFACEVTYNTTVSVSDSDLAYYGVPELTESYRVCETWIGYDYRVHAEKTSTTEPDSEWSDDMGGVAYEYGQTTPLALGSGALDEPASVGYDGFAFGQASPEEKQASYNDPYYGVYQGTSPEPCPEDPTAIICSPASMSNRAPSGPRFSLFGRSKPGVNPDADKVGKKEHGLKRKALRALLAASDEIGRSPEGFRRFRSMRTTRAGAEESIITVDPRTELIALQETRGSTGVITSQFTWNRIRGKDGRERYVRSRLDVESSMLVEGRPYTSSSTVLISDLGVAGAR